MLDRLKKELFELLPRDRAPRAAVLEEPPAAEQFCTCPECGFAGAEVWSTSDAFVAGCPQCHLEFVPVLEGMKRGITEIMKRRRRRRDLGLQQRTKLKRELMHLFDQ